ncbi:MAG: hypothetical protein HY564_01145 [Candidatus Jacksonbacteria bacterium]|nr:hypothetical protein [Candidatus Jacksonbacteria bacterium]
MYKEKPPKIQPGSDLITAAQRLEPALNEATKRKESREKFQLSEPVTSSESEKQKEDEEDKCLEYLELLLEYLPNTDAPEGFSDQEYDALVLKIFQLKEAFKKPSQTPHTETQAE